MAGPERAPWPHGFLVAEEEVLGDFVIPPADGSPTRDFQTLHFDFGLPVAPKVERDVALCTALYVSREACEVVASTRLVGLAELFGQRDWPERRELIARLARYGRTHGSWDEDGYTEGSLARVVEAAAGSAPALPAVRSEPGFLCGMEFDSLGSELAFFDRHALPVEAATVEIPLRPGQLLLFDNLALAHGRRGRREPGELHQRVYGLKRAPVERQRQLRDCVLGAFSAS